MESGGGGKSGERAAAERGGLVFDCMRRWRKGESGGGTRRLGVRLCADVENSRDRRKNEEAWCSIVRCGGLVFDRRWRSAAAVFDCVGRYRNAESGGGARRERPAVESLNAE